MTHRKLVPMPFSLQTILYLIVSHFVETYHNADVAFLFELIHQCPEPQSRVGKTHYQPLHATKADSERVGWM